MTELIDDSPDLDEQEMLPVPLREAMKGMLPERWWEGATCAQVDAELWFPEPGGSITAARAVCVTCPARRWCLIEVLSEGYQTFGVWAGVTRAERIPIHQALRAGDDVDDLVDEALLEAADGVEPLGTPKGLRPEQKRLQRWSGKEAAA